MTTTATAVKAEVPVVVDEKKALADALEMSVQSFGEYFSLKVEQALQRMVRSEVNTALNRVLVGQMATDVNDVLRKEVRAQIDALKGQIKIGLSLGE